MAFSQRKIPSMTFLLSLKAFHHYAKEFFCKIDFPYFVSQNIIKDFFPL